MEPIHIISKFPEHPVLAWKQKLLAVVPEGPCWWDRYYSYLLTNAEHPSEIGYTLAKTFDLIAKNNGSEICTDLPTYIPGNSVVRLEVLDGILKYRTKLGHIANRNLPLLESFKDWHWHLFVQYSEEPDDVASMILLWAWSKIFWTPYAPGEFYDSHYRYMIAAMLLRSRYVPYKNLFDKIKLHWTDNNKMLPRQHDFYVKDLDVKTAAWFYWLCPEYIESYHIWEHNAQLLTLNKLYELLKHGAESSTETCYELPELKVVHF